MIRLDAAKNSKWLVESRERQEDNRGYAFPVTLRLLLKVSCGAVFS